MTPGRALPWLAGGVLLAAIAVVAVQFGSPAAQPRRIGVLTLLPLPTEFDAALVRGLRDLGYVPGANLVIEYRSADGEVARYPQLAADLLARRVELVIAGDRASIDAVRGASQSLPVVVPLAGDLVKAGFAANLARPGGSVTGMSVLLPELSRKRLEVFAEAVTGLQRVGILFNARRPEVLAAQVEDVEAAAGALGIAVVKLGVGLPDGVDAGFTEARRQGLQGVYVLSDTYTIAHRDTLGAAALAHRMPTVFSNRAYLKGGGLLSYGPDIEAMFARAASYVDRILRGANPGDLAIEQPARLQLAINARTAQALGLDIPRAVLERADEVIR